MAKKTNCRNCKWADWAITETGRKCFGNWAECTYPVLVTLPASREGIAIELQRKAGVREHDDIQISCDAWERVPNAD